MDRLAQVRAAGTVVRQLPAALLRRGCQARTATTADNAHHPVVLVHGWVGSEAVWAPLRAALAAAGFGHCVSLNYNCFDTDAEAVSAELVRHAEQALVRTGAPRVHVVGHSLGGLILRHAVSDTGLGARTAAAVTVATPHRGAPLARFAPGRCARILHGVDASNSESEINRPQRWLAYYSDRDRLVPATSARLHEPGYRATNLIVQGAGHLTICRDPRFIHSLVAELIRTERGDRHDATAAGHLLAAA